MQQPALLTGFKKDGDRKIVMRPCGVPREDPERISWRLLVEIPIAGRGLLEGDHLNVDDLGNRHAIAENRCIKLRLYLSTGVFFIGDHLVIFSGGGGSHFATLAIENLINDKVESIITIKQISIKGVGKFRGVDPRSHFESPRKS